MGLGSFPSSCPFSSSPFFFLPRFLVVLIGHDNNRAGVPSIYSSTCPGTCVRLLPPLPFPSLINPLPPFIQFADNVLGSGANYANAYWEIRYIRTYTSDASIPVSSTSASDSSTQGGGGTTVVTVVTAAANPTSTSGSTSGAVRVDPVLGKGRGVVGVVGVLLLVGVLV